MSHRLPDVVEEFEMSRLRSQGMAKATVRNERQTLDHLLTQLGPVQVNNITDHAIDRFLASRQAAGNMPGTMNVHMQSLRNFFAFCQRRGYVRRNPMDGRRPFKGMPKDRLRVPAQRFPFLLDSAAHPRDRMLLALGLYLWVRESEAVNLRVGDVNLIDGEVLVRVYKSKLLDQMPICAELDIELRRWLTFYAADLNAPLEPNMYLVPAKHRGLGQDPATGHYISVPGNAHLQPHKRMVKSADIVKTILEKAGYDVRDEDGRPTREGMHTLRRSGARARFDYLLSTGYDGAIREVQAGLHHSSQQTTEKYLGITLDSQRRSRNIKGLPMYGYAAEAGNVIALGVQHNEQATGASVGM